ncbi:MAG: tRNA-dihydrouridine synthase family protein [Proteobacteria bacterium]|nr:tRNA-dihydrouridine synthase family protein [Pseudomonadota bacterium]MBU1714908.1 tRNA-dihydrouridine synthase family protein [Pseudomonadota bacterium]
MEIPAAFKIGAVVIDPPLLLAPMAGVSHSPLRRLVASFARPGLFFSEMLSARHLPEDVRANSLWLQRAAVERPMAYQIVAPDPVEAVIGARAMAGYGAEIIDLNLACPAPNISGRRRSGGHLLADLTRIEEILGALSAAVTCPLTVKIRLGTKPDLGFLRDLAGVLEGCGVAAVTLHPRLTTEKLKGRARWEYIGHLKTMTKLPVIGNGDVNSPADCLAMFQATGCDGVMIGRAAVQKPWLFAEIIGSEQAKGAHFLWATYQEAWRLITEFFPEHQALGRLKEFTWYFSRNLLFGHRLAARMQSLRSLAACREYMAEELFLRSCGFE